MFGERCCFSFFQLTVKEMIKPGQECLGRLDVALVASPNCCAGDVTHSSINECIEWLLQLLRVQSHELIKTLE